MSCFVTVSCCIWCYLCFGCMSYVYVFVCNVCVQLHVPSYGLGVFSNNLQDLCILPNGLYPFLFFFFFFFFFFTFFLSSFLSFFFSLSLSLSISISMSISLYLYHTRLQSLTASLMLLPNPHSSLSHLIIHVYILIPRAFCEIISPI